MMSRPSSPLATRHQAFPEEGEDPSGLLAARLASNRVHPLLPVNASLSLNRFFVGMEGQHRLPFFRGGARNKPTLPRFSMGKYPGETAFNVHKLGYYCNTVHCPEENPATPPRRPLKFLAGRHTLARSESRKTLNRSERSEADPSDWENIRTPNNESPPNPEAGRHTLERSLSRKSLREARQQKEKEMEGEGEADAEEQTDTRPPFSVSFDPEGKGEEMEAPALPNRPKSIVKKYSRVGSRVAFADSLVASATRKGLEEWQQKSSESATTQQKKKEKGKSGLEHQSTLRSSQQRQPKEKGSTNASSSSSSSSASASSPTSNQQRSTASTRAMQNKGSRFLHHRRWGQPGPSPLMAVGLHERLPDDMAPKQPLLCFLNEKELIKCTAVCKGWRTGIPEANKKAVAPRAQMCTEEVELMEHEEGEVGKLLPELTEIAAGEEALKAFREFRQTEKPNPQALHVCRALLLAAGIYTPASSLGLWQLFQRLTKTDEGYRSLVTASPSELTRNGSVQLGMLIRNRASAFEKGTAMQCSFLNECKQTSGAWGVLIVDFLKAFQKAAELHHEIQTRKAQLQAMNQLLRCNTISPREPQERPYDNLPNPEGGSTRGLSFAVAPGEEEDSELVRLSGEGRLVILGWTTKAGPRGGLCYLSPEELSRARSVCRRWRDGILAAHREHLRLLAEELENQIGTDWEDAAEGQAMVPAAAAGGGPGRASRVSLYLQSQLQAIADFMANPYEAPHEGAR
uniref:F-box domain-containing protein n=1 Tax=Chromera velia CCMP2878 TaxID=1169474 RepID=A0A0G4F715_9ALVE|eukprot:Cvel_15410.t1-p1 / transcript=Cvel_15410.t1 / gene=Cvel_15410 / organism=Chromera_velia_CCMP2878 / gene_product=hypothetical protein / transcript_product=hypothetical protein / location=Cvel_scaffold1138:38027-43313(-) / protein_length=742 / sequence_SO=supercontig / SO=protein_coding / is_pseudo=false